MNVYKAMAAVMADLSKVGIGKDQQNKQQGFKYRGVDDVMNTLAPSLSKHGLLIVPRVLDRLVTERESRSGGTLFHTVLRVEFDFIAAEDGSKHVVGPVIGEAMDSGDKAANKAMSIAYKYACFQAFCIPTEGMDPDAETHEVKPAGNGSGQAKSPTRSAGPTGSNGHDVVPEGKYKGKPWAEIATEVLDGMAHHARAPEAIRAGALRELVRRGLPTNFDDSSRIPQ